MKNTLQTKVRGIVAAGLMAASVLLPLGTALAQVYTTISASSQLTSQLDLGARGGDVTLLQTFLAQNPSIYPEGLITGYYGNLTQAAVVRFQLANGLPGVGRVGPMTMAKINAMIATGGTGTVSSEFTAPAIYNVSVSTYAPAGTALYNPSTGTTASCSSGTQIAYPGSANTAATCSTGVLVSSGNTTVAWQTNEAAAGKVYYSTSPLTVIEAQQDRVEPTVSGSVASDMNYTTSKSITIPNLSTTTSPVYYYMIESVDTNGNVSVVWPNNFIAR